MLAPWRLKRLPGVFAGGNAVMVVMSESESVEGCSEPEGGGVALAAAARFVGTLADVASVSYVVEVSVLVVSVTHDGYGHQ